MKNLNKITDIFIESIPLFLIGSSVCGAAFLYQGYRYQLNNEEIDHKFFVKQHELQVELKNNKTKEFQKFKNSWFYF